MADATITAIVPAINKRRGGNRHFTFAVKGSNYDTNTVVTAKLTSGGITYDWVIDDREVHSTDILLIRVKRKPRESPDKEKDDDAKIRQLEQVTVTVTNPGQTTPASMSANMATYALP
jgi:hypothetical protein